jgi:MYXO-CTERM domain-containing protein
MKKTFLWCLSVAICLMGFAGNAFAAVSIAHNQNATNAVIFGTGGNANGGFTTARNPVTGIELGPGIELGLRAKVRYNLASDSPENTFNSNGDGTFNHEKGAPASNLDRARWNFEWSINTDYNNTSGSNLSDLTYRLGLDYDPGIGTDFFVFDPINVPFADHGIGNNSTADDSGTFATNLADYQFLIDNNNLAQNSWNLAFFDTTPLPPYSFNPNVDGTYDFFLEAYERDGMGMGALLARTDIQVIVGAGAVVPEPASLSIWAGLGLLGLGLVRHRRRRQAA